MSILQTCLDEANRQTREYKTTRAANPDPFGHHDGFMDGTPDHGPMPLPIIYQQGEDWKWSVIWGVHKHPWPLTYVYCLGMAVDSRGERTALDLQFDIRDMPKKYVGRFILDRDPGCGRNSHRTIIGRALADGFDLKTISAATMR